MENLTRRGFLGVMTVVPVLAPVVGAYEGYQRDTDAIAAALEQAERSDEASEAEVVTRFADGPQRSLRGEVGLRLMHKLVKRHLRDLDLRVVGQREAQIGDRWGSGYFTKVAYLKLPHAERMYDSLAFESLAAQFAERIRAEGLIRIGRLPTVRAVEQCCLHDDKRRLAMRYVEYYEVRANAFIGCYQVLGGPA